MTTTPRQRALRSVAAVSAPVAAVALVLSAFGAATVRNDSMSPTLRSGDLVVYDRWTTPARGDIVLLSDRQGWSGEVGAVLVKRVVGVAGDVVVCCEAGSGRLLVNRVAVPEGAVWVMGDNRPASADSRASVSAPDHGAVRSEDLRGTVRAWW